MSDLRELYQEVIIDHGRHPRNFHQLEHANCQAEGFNPLCGDQLTLYLQVVDEVIHDAAFVGTGCAISTASTSLMIEAIKGMKVFDAEKLFKQFHEMLTENDANHHLGKLQALAGVREFPMRVKCATLAWHTLMAALEKRGNVVSTEE